MTAGDSFLATFDGPARAIRCAREIVKTVSGLGLPLRAGLHTGECELANGGIRGLAVQISRFGTAGSTRSKGFPASGICSPSGIRRPRDSGAQGRPSNYL
jgi:class 3 adenylate cyclase